MALTDTEIQKVKNYLGYGAVTALARPYIDVVVAFEGIIQNNLNAVGETKVRSILVILDQLDDTDIFAARKRYKAKELVGEIVLNEKEHEKLLALRSFYLDRLSDTIRIPRADSGGGDRIFLH